MTQAHRPATVAIQCATAALLCACIGSASAAWERAAAMDDGMVIYFDAATAQKTGDVVKMWGLLDYKTPETDAGGKPYQSVKLLQEFDCKAAQGRTRYYSFHSAAMGGGQLVHSEARPEAEWLPANRAKPGEILWKAACVRK